MRLVEEAFRILSESTKYGKPAMSVMSALNGVDKAIADKWWDQLAAKLISSFPDLSEDEIVKFMNTAGSRVWAEVWNNIPSALPGGQRPNGREEMEKNKVTNANSGKLVLTKIFGGSPMAAYEKELIKYAKTQLKKTIKKKEAWE